jgi:hypothetical protein
MLLSLLPILLPYAGKPMFPFDNPHSHFDRKKNSYLLVQCHPCPIWPSGWNMPENLYVVSEKLVTYIFWLLIELIFFIIIFVFGWGMHIYNSKTTPPFLKNLLAKNTINYNIEKIKYFDLTGSSVFHHPYPYFMFS